MGREKNLEFLEAIEKRKILPFAQGRKLVGKEIKAAREDLKEADVNSNIKVDHFEVK